MRLKDSPEEAAWRREVREFLAHEMPDSLRDSARGIGSLATGEEFIDVKATPEMRPGGVGFRMPEGDMNTWREVLGERGWIAPAWPKQYGGAGLSVVEQAILAEEFAEAGAPQLGGMGVSMVGPTLILHGTEEQKEEHLPKILKGETHWCQGFSEPGSGSDLASLQTRAVRDGDDYVINGSKIWTSGGHEANWMFMLGRTNPEAPKHRGISFFLMDFNSPGIMVQPLINMADIHHFNQVYFEDVRVPASNVVGEVDRGWYVATATLDFERSGIGAAVGMGQTVRDLIDFAKTNEDDGRSRLGQIGRLRTQLVDRYIEVQVAQMLSYRVVHLQSQKIVPNHEASMVKVVSTELRQRIYETALETAGLYGLLWDRHSDLAPSQAEYPRGYVEAVAPTIYGGTNEIQRNIIAQRGLGMPRS
jgi:alkylation response protein AidB-like acyl-CoA dehydrogenase